MKGELLSLLFDRLSKVSRNLILQTNLLLYRYLLFKINFNDFVTGDRGGVAYGVTYGVAAAYGVAYG